MWRSCEGRVVVRLGGVMSLWWRVGGRERRSVVSGVVVEPDLCRLFMRCLVCMARLRRVDRSVRMVLGQYGRCVLGCRVGAEGLRGSVSRAVEYDWASMLVSWVARCARGVWVVGWGGLFRCFWRVSLI